MTTPYSVQTIDPTADTDDPDGSVTVTLKEGVGYTLADSPNNQATVAVADSLPVLSITGAGGPYTEGTDSNMEFTITSNHNLGMINVRFRPLTVPSNFLAGDIEGVDQETALNFNGTTTATLVLAIDDDDVVEEDGVVLVQLLADYHVPAVLAIPAVSGRPEVPESARESDRIHLS